MTNGTAQKRHVIAWVDDDREYRSLVREWLETHYDVRDFGDGKAFMRGLEELSPDAIILDVHLPDGDGFSLCRKLRERGVDAPILFLTSSHDQEDLLRQFELDATGYLMKPIGRHQLLSRLAEVIDGERLSPPEHSKAASGWVDGAGERHGRRDASSHLIV